MNCITALAPTTHGKGSRMANLRDLICLFMNICHTNVLKTKPPDVAAKLFDSFCKVFVYSRIPPPFFLYFSSRRQEQPRLFLFLFHSVSPQISRHANAVLQNREVPTEIMYNSVWNQICFEAAKAMPENKV